MGDQIRAIADRLTNESVCQYEVLNKIEKNVAEIVDNHNRLVEEVVRAFEQDIDANQN